MADELGAIADLLGEGTTTKNNRRDGNKASSGGGFLGALKKSRSSNLVENVNPNARNKNMDEVNNYLYLLIYFLNSKIEEEKKKTIEIEAEFDVFNNNKEKIRSNSPNSEEQNDFSRNYAKSGSSFYNPPNENKRMTSTGTNFMGSGAALGNNFDKDDTSNNTYSQSNTTSGTGASALGSFLSRRKSAFIVNTNTNNLSNNTSQNSPSNNNLGISGGTVSNYNNTYNDNNKGAEEMDKNSPSRRFDRRSTNNEPTATSDDGLENVYVPSISKNSRVRQILKL